MRAAPVEPGKPPQVPVVPPFDEQIKEKDKDVLVWFCDTSPESGKVYRYRIRLKLVNPLLTYVNDVKDRDAASVPTLDTPWSEFSDPVSVPPTAEFFLTGSFPSKGQVMVTVFSTCLGQVVKQTVTVTPGQSVQTEASVDVSDPRKPTEKPIAMKVNFAAGAVVVGINFGKTILKGGVLAKTDEMLYLDSAGTLRSRLLEFDSQSDVYKKFNSQAPK